MTIREALDRHVPRVRLPEWDPKAYLEMPRLADGGNNGPWAKLFDPNVTPEFTDILITQLLPDTNDRYEATPPHADLQP